MRVVLLFVAITLSVLLPEPVFSQVICKDRDTLVIGLKREYKEVPRGIGITLSGNIVEIFRSDRTFSIILTTPDGRSCFLAAGRDWEQVALPEKGRVM